MKDVIFTVIKNVPLAENVYEMTLCGDTSDIVRPGQFVNIKIDGLYLRRPISVCDKTDEKLMLIYKTVGKGTEQMARMPAGTELSVLSGLGNGYDTAPSGDHPLVIGGGVGVPPMYLLCKRLCEEGKHVSVVLGFNRACDVFYEDKFKALGADVTVMTADGSYGGKGFVTDGLPAEYSYCFACGPEPMLRAVFNSCKSDGQLSFEERMGCGFGACMGCSCKTITGYKRICKDGPVLYREEILWEK